MMNGTAAPAGLPSRNTSILAMFSGSNRNSMRRPVRAGSTEYEFPSSGTVATRVTRRVTDQRNASASTASGACRCGPPAVNRSIGACPVSACTRRFATCPAHAANRSFSCSRDSMPWWHASARNASRI